MVQEIDTLLAQYPKLKIHFQNVKGHSGIAGNEHADRESYNAVMHANENGPFQTISWLNI